MIKLNDEHENNVNILIPVIQIEGNTWIDGKSLLLAMYEAEGKGFEIKEFIKGMHEFMRKPVIK